jgi:2-polyprenyl-6-methoxyphenol hydroxylase-like FAD-dependent oxidoreductase
MTQSVVVVGGGIAGSALAYALATADVDVVVLEASEEFADRVRGEGMHVWGVAEARQLGVERVLLDAGAHIAPVWRSYTEGVSEARDIPMSIMQPGIDGTLNLRHPDACQALIDAAAAAGAKIERGVRDVKLSAGPPVGVDYRVSDDRREIAADLVVGADGRTSTVRKQTGITLEHSETLSYTAGLLLDGLDGVPDDHDVIAGEADQFFVLFHQGGGRARAYLVTGASGRNRFAGANAASRFLDATAISAYPWSAAVSSATPAGPCATYPGDDTWTASPHADGVVLIGDAAGYNDPIIGQGLSIAMRDARIVRDLVLNNGHGPIDFRPYAEERLERMRRLRLIADILTVTHVEDGADNRPARRARYNQKMAEMDPELFPLVVGAFAGPETVAADLVDESVLDRIRNA